MKGKQKGDFLSTRVRWLPVEEIHPNPAQPRRNFDARGLQELAESIRAYGILQPLTVRRTGAGYELVAGERRLRSAKLAGERQVPCLVAQVGEEDSALLALIENLQRRDLDCWEEAEAIARLIAAYHLTQESKSFLLHHSLQKSRIFHAGNQKRCGQSRLKSRQKRACKNNFRHKRANHPTQT